MSEINFKELLQKAVEAKASGCDKSGIVDVAVVTFACLTVLTVITTNCFGDQKTSLPPTPSDDKK